MKPFLIAVGFLSMSCAGWAQGGCPCPSDCITITTPANLPGAYAGVSYSQAIAVNGCNPPFTLALTAGALPAGLTFSSAGEITGMPTALGTSAFDITVTDAHSVTATQSFSLTVSLTSLSITTPGTLPSGFTGVPYSKALVASGGIPPYIWTVVSGPLPPGLTMSSGGLISGTPTASGTTVFDISVGYSIFSTTQTFTLTIGGAPLSISTPALLPAGTTGSAYSQTLTASGGVPAYTWSVLYGVLPPGLALSSAGVIAGTPTGPGTYIFTAQVKDTASLTATQAFNLTVTLAGVLPRAGVISQFAAGGGWDTTIWLINKSAAPVSTGLRFYGDDGNRFSLSLTITGPHLLAQQVGDAVDQVIAPNTTLVVAIHGPATVVQGWADVLSSGPVTAFAIFRDAGAAEAAVPLQSQIGASFSLPFDNTNGYSTGVAIANLSGLPASITATVWDEDGNQFVPQPVVLTKSDPAGNGHDSFMLPDRLPVTAGKRGIVQFQGSPATQLVPAAPVTGLGLRADPNGLFTSTPTIVP